MPKNTVYWIGFSNFFNCHQELTFIWMKSSSKWMLSPWAVVCMCKNQYLIYGCLCSKRSVGEECECRYQSSIIIMSQEKLCSLYLKEHKVAAGWFRNCPFISVSWSLPSGPTSWQTKTWDINVFMKETSRHYWWHLMAEVRVLPIEAHLQNTARALWVALSCPHPAGCPPCVRTFQDISSHWNICISIGTILSEQFLLCK